MSADAASNWRPGAFRVTAPVLAALAFAVLAGSCGFRPEKVGQSLPPLTAATTTTSTLATTTTQPRYYVVQRGDSISSIAAAFGVSSQELIALNGITNPDQIQAGQTLQLPPSTVVVTAPPAAGDTSSVTSAP